MLRNLGEWSHWIPIALLVILAVGLYKRHARNAAIAAGALLTAIFSSIYAAFCLIVVSMYLTGYSDLIQKNQEAEQNIAPNRSQPSTQNPRSSVQDSED